jgi:hypothetical protein
VSLPNEHGAYLTLVGSAATAVLVAPAPGPALGAAVALATAFLSRGPLERRARGAALRVWDGPALALLAGLAIAGVVVAAAVRPPALPVVISAALAVPVAALLAKRSRRTRTEAFEMAALGALGASAGLAAWCGGLPIRAAAAVALVLGTHAATSVPVVRSVVRGRPRVELLLASSLALVAAVVAVVLAGTPLAALALLPRAATLIGARAPAVKTAPKQVGWREAGVLALVVVLLLAGM